MKLVNVTNSYKQLVNKQLENTDAYFVKVYSAETRPLSIQKRLTMWKF